MGDVPIDVYRGGRLIKTVERPIRVIDGVAHVTYKGRSHRVINGRQIHIDAPPARGGEQTIPPATSLIATATPPTATAPSGAGSAGANSERTNAARQANTPIEWDPAQLAVIEAPPGDRLLVDAGPGTGKTEVACARVASLIKRNIEPANIWLISFTRTAVQEIRDRIAKLSENESAAAAVRITTLDSHAWYLVQGFESDRTGQLAGYEQTIENAIELLRKPNEEMAEYISSVEHVIVDEAQDLVGSRADLVETLISAVSRDCGVTVFADEAQAIYGFAEDADALESGSLPLPRRIRNRPVLRFRQTALQTVHRTSSVNLLHIFTITRNALLSGPTVDRATLDRVRADINSFNDGLVGPVDRQELSGRSDTLVLFRRRVDVLMASSYLWSASVTHRIRMSGLPSVVHGWIAIALWDYTSPSLTSLEFLGRFHDRVVSDAAGGLLGLEAWELLVRVAGVTKDRVDMRRLRAQLARQQPPVGLYHQELGPTGPMIGTIHASKGREAPNVHLMLPAIDDERECNFDEESRVVFVGATRARQSLRIGAGFSTGAARLEETLRCYRGLRRRDPARAQVEIGREGDVDHVRQVSTSLFSHQSDALASQHALAALTGKATPAIAVSDYDDSFTYKLRLRDDERAPNIGALVPSVNADLFRVGKLTADSDRRLRLPREIRHLHVVGVRTVALAADDPNLNALHPPFCDSGLFIAPVVFGFTTIHFYEAKSRAR